MASGRRPPHDIETPDTPPRRRLAALSKPQFLQEILMNATKQAVIAQLVKQNVAVMDKMNGISWNCLCCIGC